VVHEHTAVHEHHHGSHHHHDRDHNHSYHDSETQPEQAFARVHRHNWWGGHGYKDTSERPSALVHSHTHPDVQPHHHHHASDTPRAPLSLKSLFALGVTGGIVPCPAALVVLLSALAIHRVAFGLFLIVAFSVGLAALLIGLGLATVFAGRFMSRFAARGPLTEQWLPLLSSAVITTVGITLAAQSLASAGVLRV